MGGIVRSRRRNGGFTLIEIVVVMAILSLVIAMAAAITRALSSAQKRSLTVTRMAAVDAALLQFVQQTKRLPCPANGALPSTDGNAGRELRDAVTGACTLAEQQGGVVPWLSLGLTEADATDAWDRRFTYRTDPTLAGQNSPMDMSWCDPAGSQGALPASGRCDTACSPSTTGLGSCTPPGIYIYGKGLQVQNLAGSVLMNPNPPAGSPHTGAAYVVISHGETGGGGYLASGNLGVSTVTDGAGEVRNYANRRYPSDSSYFVDDTINEAGGTGHFDDIVSRPGLLGVINKAGLGPRSH